MSVTTTWTVTPPDDTGDADPVVVSFEVGEPSVHTPGEEVVFEFAVVEAAGEPAPADRHARLMGYERLTTALATGVDLKGIPWYREQHGRAGESVLCAIRPPDDLATRGARGAWGVVSGIEDLTGGSRSLYRLELSITYLAALDEYPTAAGVRNAFEADSV